MNQRQTISFLFRARRLDNKKRNWKNIVLKIIYEKNNRNRITLKTLYDYDFKEFFKKVSTDQNVFINFTGKCYLMNKDMVVNAMFFSSKKRYNLSK